jgi:hypothetical protein
MTPELKERQLGAYQEVLRLHEEGYAILKRTVTDDEGLLHYTSLRRRGQAKIAVIQAHRNPENFLIMPVWKKISVTVFWDY